MFNYKEASFYTSYFNNLQDFKLIEDFKKSVKENNIYVGIVEVLGTVHPLIIRVEIPFSFPHMRLIFRTKSLSGYPHLIHTGKLEYGDWFCLNTPFSETAEGQLEQELLRLKEWVIRQMKKELPPIIEDSKVVDALKFINLYEWENLDELDHYSSAARLTFVGDVGENKNFVKDKIGNLNCLRTRDKRFYVLNNEEYSNFKMPYIIVDEELDLREGMNDFLLLKQQYGWSDEVCRHLLPQLNFDLWELWGTSLVNKHYTEVETLDIIKMFKEDLSQDSFNLSGVKVLPAQREILLKELNKIKDKKDYKLKNDFSFVDDGSYDNMSEENEYKYEEYEYGFHYFALGINMDGQINWILVCTNRAALMDERITFDIKIKNIILAKNISCQIGWEFAQSVSEESFFGRGAFSKKTIGKKIGLIGLGAIGSILAESLARSGVIIDSFWDNDIVEPGNICRSIYTLGDLGKSKVEALKQKIFSIHPFVDEGGIITNGVWIDWGTNGSKYDGGSFYGNINYDNQEKAINSVKDYDIIIDCTGSNEMLHFLSYASLKTSIISLCITNHANELLCVTSRDGNPFELRKAYLSRIEQDTKNFFFEGSGCYSPTFFATNSDIASLVNLVVRDLNIHMDDEEIPHSTIWSHDRSGVIADRIETYKLHGYDIKMTISSETIFDAQDLSDVSEGLLGYLLGCYSKDGKLILITHIIEPNNAETILQETFKTSNGIIDYIGDYAYSSFSVGSYMKESMEAIHVKSIDESINTCNPILAVRNTDRTINFFLYINNKLIPFMKEA